MRDFPPFCRPCKADQSPTKRKTGVEASVANGNNCHHLCLQVFHGYECQNFSISWTSAHSVEPGRCKAGDLHLKKLTGMKKNAIFLLHSEGRKGMRKEGRKKGRTEGWKEEHKESVCTCMFHFNFQRKAPGSHEMSWTTLVRCSSRVRFAFHSCQRFNERCKALMLGVTGGGVTQLAAKHQ